MKQWRGKRSVRENLRSRMAGIVADYIEAGDQALLPGTPWEQVHRFRLLTKRFRYTIEIFKKAYGPGLQRRIELLKELQTLLGEINDLMMTSRMLTSVEGMEAVREKMSVRADKKTADLRRLWDKHFAAQAARQSWQRYLVQYACRPPRVAEPSEAPSGPEEAV